MLDDAHPREDERADQRPHSPAQSLTHPLLFGAFITPDAHNHERTVALAVTADSLGLDIVGIQDHPYQPAFLDTWTLLSALATQTKRVILFPDVATLPLRPPSVLAKSAASLDLLSGGRVELGLGAGAFPRGVEAMGGPIRSPGESVEALQEAVEVIRSLWTPGAGVFFTGKHYSLQGAKPGPVPPHPIGIFIGSYKPRMLRLTGRVADGWIPSSAYASPIEIAELAAIIDEAALRAGREPNAIRRWYNVAGSFTSRENKFLHGSPALWAEQLAELALEQGISGFILGPGAAAEADLRRFAEEVAPAVRAAVAAERGAPSESSFAAARGASSSMADRAARGEEAQLDLAPSDRTTGRALDLDESTRPHLPTRKSPVEAGKNGAASADALVSIHNHLRGELEQLRGIVEQVAAGHTSPAAARSLINRMSMRQNYWTLGAFCAAYCRLLTVHHAIEDARMFVDLRSRDESLAPVIERLSEEHEVIAGILTRLDESLVAMVADPAQLAAVQAEVDRLDLVLLSHLDYEEAELLDPIRRLDLTI